MIVEMKGAKAAGGGEEGGRKGISFNPCRISFGESDPRRVHDGDVFLIIVIFGCGEYGGDL